MRYPDTFRALDIANVFADYANSKFSLRTASARELLLGKFSARKVVRPLRHCYVSCWELYVVSYVDFRRIAIYCRANSRATSLVHGIRAVYLLFR